MTWSLGSFFIGFGVGAAFVIGDIWLFIKFGPKCPPGCLHCRM